LVRPHLDYCKKAWKPYLRKDVNMIESDEIRMTSSGGARVHDQGGHFFSVGRQISFLLGASMECLYRAPLAAPIRDKRLTYGAPLPPEAPYQIH